MIELVRDTLAYIVDLAKVDDADEAASFGQICRRKRSEYLEIFATKEPEKVAGRRHLSSVDHFCKVNYIEREYGAAPKRKEVLPGIAWKETPGVKRSGGVAIVYAHESAEERAVLERLGKALEREGKAVTSHRAPAAVPACDLVLVTRTALSSCELPDCPQLVVEDVSLYIKQPGARRELWEAILRHVG